MKYVLTLILFILPATSFAAYTTYNSSDKATKILLSNGDLTQEAIFDPTYVPGSVRTLIAVGAGKYYWEVSLDDQAAPSTAIGIADAVANINNYCGQDSHGWGYLSEGVIKHSSGTIDDVPTYNDGDILSAALDMDNHLLQFYKNGSEVGNPISIGSGPYYACAGTPGDQETTTANFGDSSFAYSVPPGYCAGLADSCTPTPPPAPVFPDAGVPDIASSTIATFFDSTGFYYSDFRSWSISMIPLLFGLTIGLFTSLVGFVLVLILVVAVVRLFYQALTWLRVLR